MLQTCFFAVNQKVVNELQEHVYFGLKTPWSC